ncbi:hypothetical protein BKA67DRAFT_123937 [Truncatella angustata]|uniref:Nitrogen regulatory protein areA GATA-like domain-containing protein n=1 Tax=Truncatella angustata TaxID=152316 RepID=A0A9P8UC47_9PEZI|nr:uncharacterized protein BKA67DRAFT_123937 [Truncatella angustata]KAH6645725.1 hypothetical protein BKA67DRAFT_123937 [Truncatella angustata]
MANEKLAEVQGMAVFLSPDDNTSFSPLPSPQSHPPPNLSYERSSEHSHNLVAASDPVTLVTNSTLEISEINKRAGDDTLVQRHPSNHVDYLSHDWVEEDIWSSWRYLVSNRGECSNAQRLENASWRAWTKTKCNLKTVSPETINWLRDCDVTWLYGPLQQCRPTSLSRSMGRTNSTSPMTNVSIVNKSNLRKMSIAETLRLESRSLSSVLKQATKDTQPQHLDRRGRVTRLIVQTQVARERALGMPSKSTSEIETHIPKVKCVQFDERVEQCIAMDSSVGVDKEEREHEYRSNVDDSDSGEGAVMMKIMRSRRKSVRAKPKPKPETYVAKKTIMVLPSTTLKYDGGTPHPSQTAMEYDADHFICSIFSPSSPLEVLRRPTQSHYSPIRDDESPHINEKRVLCQS